MAGFHIDLREPYRKGIGSVNWRRFPAYSLPSYKQRLFQFTHEYNKYTDLNGSATRQKTESYSTLHNSFESQSRMSIKTVLQI
ncbi:MAG: hypothetical protein IPH84_03495 [Bacteroidales bacterium]|nr:hypothetical protein [Bacteroidales bacterium]